jgi:hypothetical protein
VRSRLVGFAAYVLLFTLGCRGGVPTPVAPGPPVPAAETITITSGVDALRTGFFADYTLIASMSDRTTQVVTRQAVWTTSDLAVGTVDANGRVTAVSHGTIGLNATFQGRAATRSVRIVHNYGGQWNGTYVARSCDQTGVFASSRYCQNLGSNPSPLGLEMTQSGVNVDEISGMIALRGLVGPVSGRVTSDGRLALSGSYVAVSGGASQRVEIPSWSTLPAGSFGMTGSFVQRLTVVGLDGAVTQTNEIVTATRRVD